eukprot:scpid41909/ scgid10577/ Nucleolar MIF4G domain-containing protein 1; SGD1 homolog
MGRHSRSREAPNLARARADIQRLVGDGSKTTSVSRKSRRKLQRLEKKQGKRLVGKSQQTEATGFKIATTNKDGAGIRRNKADSSASSKFSKGGLDFANRFEDREIHRLEKQLKLTKRGKKLPKGFADDGLDYLLEVCDHVSTSAPAQAAKTTTGTTKPAKRLTELEKYVQEKRNAAAAAVPPAATQKVSRRGYSGDDACDDNDSSTSEEEMDDEFAEDADATVGGGASDDDDVLFGCEDSDIDDDESDGDVEYDYSESDGGDDDAPMEADNATRYSAASSKEMVHDEKFDQLARQVKGLINRLCESTLKTTSNKIQQLFSTNSRNNTNTCLSRCILAVCITPALQPDRLLAEHMLLVAVLHRTVDTDVGCHFLEELVKHFDSRHRHQGAASSTASGTTAESSKECDNVVAMLAHLYLFKVAHYSLIIDIIKRLLGRFQDEDITMLLQLLKTCGGDIRKDDPSALKEVISTVRSRSKDTTRVDESRMRFTIDALMAVCHNNFRKLPGYDPDSIRHRSRVLRGMLPGSVALADAQMRIGYLDLANAQEKGRWWVVGSAWTGRSTSARSTASGQQPASDSHVVLDEKLSQLARVQHLNTDLRKNIFGILMTCEDVVDAFQKLLRLNLKGQQEREIVHVVLHCCFQEKEFNIFYACLCAKLAAYSRSHQITIRLAIWDRLKSLASMNKRQTAVLRKLMLHFLLEKTLTLALIKNVDFSHLDPASLNFFQDLFVDAVVKYPPGCFQKIVEKSSCPPPIHLPAFLRFVGRQIQETGSQLLAGGKNAKYVRQQLEGIADACRS